MRLSWEMRDGQMFAVWGDANGLLVDGEYRGPSAVFLPIPGPGKQARVGADCHATARRSHSR